MRLMSAALLSTSVLLACTSTPPPDPEETCATVLCPPDTVCEMLGGHPTCQAPPAPSCEDVTCQEGSHCELQDVVCVRAPCPPLPTCVANPVRCDSAADCQDGQVCAEGTWCPACVYGDPPCRVACQITNVCQAPPAGEPCGNTVCGAGLVCCNASCGMCAGPDEACIQIACDDLPENRAALNAYFSKVVGEKQGSFKGGSATTTTTK